MRIISARIAHKLRAHACWFSSLPTISVPSAAVSDQDVEEWSREALARDLDAEKPSQFRRLYTRLTAAYTGPSGVQRA